MQPRTRPSSARIGAVRASGSSCRQGTRSARAGCGGGRPERRAEQVGRQQDRVEAIGLRDQEALHRLRPHRRRQRPHLAEVARADVAGRVAAALRDLEAADGDVAVALDARGQLVAPRVVVDGAGGGDLDVVAVAAARREPAHGALRPARHLAPPWRDEEQPHRSSSARSRLSRSRTRRSSSSTCSSALAQRRDELEVERVDLQQQVLEERRDRLHRRPPRDRHRRADPRRRRDQRLAAAADRREPCEALERLLEQQLDVGRVVVVEPGRALRRDALADVGHQPVDVDDVIRLHRPRSYLLQSTCAPRRARPRARPPVCCGHRTGRAVAGAGAGRCATTWSVRADRRRGAAGARRSPPAGARAVPGSARGIRCSAAGPPAARAPTCTTCRWPAARCGAAVRPSR